jgi:uncharacterized protein (DUF2147 family)
VVRQGAKVGAAARCALATRLAGQRLRRGVWSLYFGRPGNALPRATNPFREASTSIARFLRPGLRPAALVAGLLSLAPSVAALAQAVGVSGVWNTEHRDAKIRIAACGPALCGTIVGLAQPVDSDGRAKTDVNNPDPAKRARPLVGLTLLTGLTPSGEASGGTWRGVIYNADNGKDYDVSVRLIDERHAAIRGCILGGLFCGGETWTRD